MPKGSGFRGHQSNLRVSILGQVPRKQRISKSQIVETARRLFRAQGYHGTTLDQVAAELGVTRAALYHWLPSKESVLCEIHEQVMDALLEKLELILAEDADETERLKMILRTHIVMVAANLDAITVFFQDEASLPADPAHRIAEKKRYYDHSLEMLVRAAQAKGAIRNDLDSKIIVKSLMGMCNWIYLWFDPDGSASADEVADTVIEMAVAGLHPPSRRATQRVQLKTTA